MMTRGLIFLFGLFSAVSLTLSACWGGSSTSQSQPQVVDVRRSILEVSISTTGALSMPNQSRLTFGNSGTVQQISVKEGDRVRKGQVLAKLDNLSLERAVVQAENDLRKAQQALRDAQDLIAQATRLAKSSEAVATARISLDQAQQALAAFERDQAQQLAQARQAKANAETALDQAQQALASFPTDHAQQVAQAQQAKANAETALDQAQQALASFPTDYVQQVAQARQAKANAETALDQAQQALVNFEGDQAQQLAQARQAKANAETALDQAQQTLANFDQDYALQLAQARQAAANAQTALNTAQTNYSNFITRARPEFDQAQLQQLQAAVNVAQVTFDNAQDDLARLEKGPDPLVSAQRQATVATAQAALTKAQDDLARLEKGPDPLVRTQRQATVATAQATLAKTQDDLSRLEKGPDPLSKLQLETRLKTSEANLKSALGDLEKASAGPDPDVVQDRQITVTIAESNLADARERLDQATIMAPYDGIVAQLPVNVGDTVAASTLIALVVDPAQLEIRTTVDEIDVLKVRVGQEVRLSLESLQGLSQEDLSALLGALQGAGAGQGSGATPPQGRGAFGGQPPSGFVPGQGPGPGGAPSGRPPFAGGRQGQQTDGTPAATPQATGTPSSGQTPAPVGTAAAPGGLGQRAGGQAGRPAAGLRGQVSKVDVLATRTQGVVTYGITISVSTPPGVTLREGLTTVASIITESKENVLIVPNRAIRTQSGQRFVTVSLPDGKTEQRAVRVGSTDGQSTEILDGLQEGDKVIVSTATRSGTTGGQGQLGIPFGGGPGGPPPGGFR